MPVNANVRPIEEADLEAVLAWRNAPQVRSFMFTQDEISLDQHIGWFKALKQNSNHYALLVETEKFPLGVVNLVGMHPGVASWGFYVVPNSPRGTGLALCAAALQYAFEQLHLHKLYGEALAYNERSIRFHKRLGFCDEGTLRSHRLVEGVYRDVRCFGLLADEWSSANG